MAKSLSGDEVAHLLIEFISTELGIYSSLIIAVMNDRASVNAVPCALSLFYTTMFLM